MFSQSVAPQSFARRWKLAGVALFIVLLAPSPTQAFYWPGWPGAGVTEPPSLTPRQIVREVPPPTTPTESTVPPKGVPEPATLVIAGLGLGVLGLRRVLKRKK